MTAVDYDAPHEDPRSKIPTEALADLLANPARAAEVAPEPIAALLLAAVAEHARVAAIGAALAARLAIDAPHGPRAAARAPERLLSAKEVAARMSHSVDWVYEHKKE